MNPAGSPLSVIPAPAECRLSGGPPFRFGADTCVSHDAAAAGAAAWFVRWLGLRTVGDGHPADITLTVDAGREGELGPEGYCLTIAATGVTVLGAAAAGVFYGLQTLRQLLPPASEQGPPAPGSDWSVPAGEVVDRPRFGWRGLMLDVSRHFFSVGEVKKLLDLMALQKLNVFHWHLTDDQGWRVEIKKYPRLTEIGAWRDESPLRGQRQRGDRLRHGGYYTQEQIREVVAYAAARFITVVPEIDLPGHSAAAIAAYPELGNRDVPGYAPQVMTRWGIKPYTYAPTAGAFTFLEDVLGEIIALFPGRYIHIGGDEAPKTQWQQSAFAQDFQRQHGLANEDELQSHFIARAGRFLRKRDRQLIGWDEIQEGGTPEGATVMVWRTHVSGWNIPGKKAPPNWEHLLSAVRDGHEVVVTPASHFYFDFNQVDPARSAEPEAIGGLTTLEQVYHFEPVPDGLTPSQLQLVRGIEGAIWTEYIWDFPKLEYMAFPRMCAMAETAWSPREGREFAGFRRRLDVFQQRLDELGVLYCPAGSAEAAPPP